MDRVLRRRPSPAMVVALIALVVALSGTTYAATQLPAKSVGTKQVRDRAVTGSKLATGAVGTRQLADGGVKGRDVDESTLEAVPSARAADTAGRATSADTSGRATLATRALTADRATSAERADSTATATSAARLDRVTRVTAPVSIPDGFLGEGAANCPPHSAVTGGGWENGPSSSDLFTIDSFPDSGDSWRVRFVDVGSDVQDSTATVYALCVPTATP